MKNTTTIIIFTYLLLSSVLFTFIISHEIVHYIRIDTATGVCLGGKDIGFVPYIDFKGNIQREESIATIFGLMFTTIYTLILFLFIYKNWININLTKFGGQKTWKK